MSVHIHASHRSEMWAEKETFSSSTECRECDLSFSEVSFFASSHFSPFISETIENRLSTFLESGKKGNFRPTKILESRSYLIDFIFTGASSNFLREISFLRFVLLFSGEKTRMRNFYWIAIENLAKFEKTSGRK